MDSPALGLPVHREGISGRSPNGSKGTVATQAKTACTVVSVLLYLSEHTCIDLNIYMHLHVHPATYVDLCTPVQYPRLNMSSDTRGSKAAPALGSESEAVLPLPHRSPSGPRCSAMSTDYQRMGRPSLRDASLCRYHSSRRAAT